MHTLLQSAVNQTSKSTIIQTNNDNNDNNNDNKDRDNDNNNDNDDDDAGDNNRINNNNNNGNPPSCRQQQCAKHSARGLQLYLHMIAVVQKSPLGMLQVRICMMQ